MTLSDSAVVDPLFSPLAAVGLAPALRTEAKGLAHAAAIILFHRRIDEDRALVGAFRISRRHGRDFTPPRPPAAA